jgi:hypothetical protein
MGECHVHAGIDPEDIRLRRAEHPGAEFLIHPECGCSTSVLEAMSAGDIDPEGVQILSTEGMIKRPAQSPATEFIVATEVGILHRLRRENPTKRFVAANERASCAYMKVTTLPKVKRALERLEYRITVPPDVANRARRAIERMIAIGGQHPLSPVPASTIDPGEKTDGRSRARLAETTAWKCSLTSPSVGRHPAPSRRSARRPGSAGWACCASRTIRTSFATSCARRSTRTRRSTT